MDVADCETKPESNGRGTLERDDEELKAKLLLLMKCDCLGEMTLETAVFERIGFGGDKELKRVGLSCK